MLGAQQPRIFSAPAYHSSAADEVIELCELAGLYLDEWQKLVLRHALGEKPDGTWAAFEVACVLPRQNGKNGILEARELGGLFVLDERLLIHSAHQFDTSLEAYRRLKFLVENTPELDKRVRRYMNSHGEEGIELKNGRRIRFRTRTKGGGRGFSGDFVAFDEAMIFPESSLAAILPIVSARPNPQVWYTGSAVDQAVHDEGMVLSRVRRRGVEGDPRLAYFEWSIDKPTPADVDDETAGDPLSWAAANPALGIRISPDYVEGERRSLGHRAFAVERLGVGDWPDPDADRTTVIDPGRWQELEDTASTVHDPVVVAFDVVPDRSSAAIAVAGTRGDGLDHVEVVEHKRGTGWVVQRLAELAGKHQPLGVFCAGAASASLMPELETAGIEVTAMSGKDLAGGCGVLFDAVEQRRLRHLGQQELAAALRGAEKRLMGDAWTWSRKTTAVDISPLVAVTVALAGWRTLGGRKPKDPPKVIDLSTV